MALKVFPEIRKFAWASKKSQKWDTVVQRSASGRTRTLTMRIYPEWTVEASLPAVTDDEARELMGFVALLNGSGEAFLWYDPEDNTVTKQMLPRLNGREFQAVMRFGSYIEPVFELKNIVVYINDELCDDTLYSFADGVVTFNEEVDEDSVVKATYEYYWRMQFADDGVSVNRVFTDINKISLKLVSVR